MRRPWPTTSAVFLVLECAFLLPWESGNAMCLPDTGCDIAYAFYRVQVGKNLTAVGQKFQTTEGNILAANPSIINVSHLVTGSPLFIPFSCDCIKNQLIHKFQYTIQDVDSVSSITTTIFENRTQESWVATANSISDVNFILTDSVLDIPVNCSCGNPAVTSDYGPFLTYVVMVGIGGNLSGVASYFNTSADLLQKFNPDVVWVDSEVTQYAFIPVTDRNGNSPRYAGQCKEIYYGVTRVQ